MDDWKTWGSQIERPALKENPADGYVEIDEDAVAIIWAKSKEDYE